MAYVNPRRNPLRLVPVRGYYGPLASRLPGLGQVGTPGGCPGSPGCPGYAVPVPSVSDTDPIAAAVAAALAAQQQQKPAGGTFTDWLNTNAKTAAWIGGIAVGVLLLSRVR